MRPGLQGEQGTVWDPRVCVCEGWHAGRHLCERLTSQSPPPLPHLLDPKADKRALASRRGSWKSVCVTSHGCPWRWCHTPSWSGVYHIGSTEGTPGHFPHILIPPRNSHALKLLSTSTQTETLVELVKICPTYNRLPTVFLLLMLTVLPLSPWPVPRFWFSNLLSQGYCLLGFYKGWQPISKLTYFWF